MKKISDKLPRRLKSVIAFASGTLLSRLFGFARDVSFAVFFGSNPIINAFLVAFQIPNFTRRLFAEGAFSQAFIPVLKAQKDQSSTQQLINQVFLYGCIIIFGLTGIAWLSAPWLVRLFAPGFMYHSNQIQQTAQLLRITLFFVPFISIAAFAAAILQCNRYFYITAIMPVLLNVCLITAAVLSKGTSGLYLAYAVPLAGALQCVLLFLYLKKLNLLPKIQYRLPPLSRSVRKMLAMMRTTLLSASIAQMSLVIDTIIASFLPLGSIAWLYYSQRLVYLPLGVFAVAISTIVLPEMNQDLSSPDNHRIIRWGLHLNCLLGIPAAIGLAFLAGPCILTLFGHGHFVLSDTLHTQQSLWLFASACRLL